MEVSQCDAHTDHTLRSDGDVEPAFEVTKVRSGNGKTPHLDAYILRERLL